MLKVALDQGYPITYPAAFGQGSKFAYEKENKWCHFQLKVTLFFLFSCEMFSYHIRR